MFYSWLFTGLSALGAQRAYVNAMELYKGNDRKYYPSVLRTAGWGYLCLVFGEWL